RYRQPDGTGTLVHPLLGDNRINPAWDGSRYPLHVFKEDMDLTAKAACPPFNLWDWGEPAWRKKQHEPFPAAALEKLTLATNGDRALVYAALLLAHPRLLPEAMCAVTRNLTLLSSGVAIGPGMAGNLHQAKKTAFHFDTGQPGVLRVTY